jgi:hypothetical protein
VRILQSAGHFPSPWYWPGALSLTSAGFCQPMVILVGGFVFDPTLTGSPENTALM